MGTPLLWLGFNAFVLAAIAIDLGLVSRRLHKISLHEAAFTSFAWVLLSLCFGAGIFYFAGRPAALQFFTGYLIEKALSVDNLFLFLIIFRKFAVDERYQHRLLEWGILGALIMRGAMIAAGAALIARFSWVLYGLGAFLVYAGAHMFFLKKESVQPEQNPLFRLASRHLRVTRGYHGADFFIRSIGRLYATPLFLVLLVIEITDVTLAIDSIPAVFGVTRDPFIVYTSNVFAVLGLRALYFLLARALNRLRFLDFGLAFVLIFIGAKMIAEPWVHVTERVSLIVVAGILLVAIAVSVLNPAKPNEETEEPPARSTAT